MRLIDGDALIAWIKGSQQMTSKMKAIVAKIETMPTVDRPSVVDLTNVYTVAYENGYREGIEARPQGEWIQNDKIGTFKVWDCSRCGIHMETRWKFCPWCGAKMDGERKTND